MGPAQPAANTLPSADSTAAASVPSIMSAPSLSIEQLPANIPCLEPNSVNWAIFSMRFQEAMQATCCWGYFDGSKSRPMPKDKDNLTDAEVEAREKWDYKDLITCYLLSQRLPDTTAICVSGCNTVKEHWEEVSEEFSAKSVYAQNDLEHAFLQMRCPRGGDIWAFLTNLMYKHKELAAAGITISTKDYECTILRGIPEDLAKFTAHLLSSACLIYGTTSIDTNTLISHICKEAERMKNRRMQDQLNQGGKKEGQTDEALAATGSDGGKKKQHCKGKCHNCGKPGHWAHKCHSPKKEEGASGQAASLSSLGTASKPEMKPVGSANIVTINKADDNRTIVANDANGNGFWMVLEEDAPAQDISMEPDTLLDDPVKEQLEEVACAHTESEEVHLEWCAPEGWVHDDWADLLFEEEEACAVIIPATDKNSSTHTELYDSGATWHISPYKSDFSSYKPLSLPVFLNTANQQHFPAIRTGTLTIQVPNEGTASGKTSVINLR